MELQVRTLADCEAVIERGLTTFIEVGEALLEIRDRRLYLEGYSSFDDYCRDRWGISRIHAHRLIEASEVTRMLPTGNTPAPTTERQARELAPLRNEPERMAEAWKEAVDHSNGKPTAEVVRAAVDQVRERTEQRQQDREELQALTTDLVPPDFDPVENADQVRQRGEFSRLCRDLAALPTAPAFIARHGDRLSSDHVRDARAAYVWLGDFFEKWSER